MWFFENGPFSKHHMVSIIEFQNPSLDTNLNKWVYTARVSMELSPTNFCALTGSVSHFLCTLNNHTT